MGNKVRFHELSFFLGQYWSSISFFHTTVIKEAKPIKRSVGKLKRSEIRIDSYYKFRIKTSSVSRILEDPRICQAIKNRIIFSLGDITEALEVPKLNADEDYINIDLTDIMG